MTRTVSGSSGGAAAALAAGLTVLADSSDLGGSIRAPAGFAGVVGLRPTARVVPLQGTALPIDNLNTPGAMARSLGDVRLMLEVMAGASALAPWSQKLAAETDLKMQGLRVAWCRTPVGAPIAPEIATALEPIRNRLAELGAQITDIDPDLGVMLEAQRVT